jgi:formate dehydrogenase iron-sulfur subunit
MGFKIFVPIDSTSLSLGADDVADLIAATAKKRNIDVTIIRNGSRGMFWLEPLVEVETDDGRLAYGPIEVNDVDSLFDCEFYLGGQHPKYLGPTEELTWLKKTRKTNFCPNRHH